MKLTSWLSSERHNFSSYLRRPIQVIILFFVIAFFTHCKNHRGLPPGDKDNGGLVLPDSFEAVVVAEKTGRARHIAVSDKGDVYVKLRSPEPKGILAMRDTDNDGKADDTEVFGDYDDQGDYGTGMRIYNGYLYFSTAGEVYRIKLDGNLVPKGKVELIMKDDYKNDIHGYEHIAKPITFDDSGHLYVQFGAPGDVCQLEDRIPGKPGQDPCPELIEHGGIWQFDANKLNQTQKEGKRYATGIRSIVGMDWNHEDNSLYALQHGRDDMHRTWPAFYTTWQSAMLPSEEFLKIKEGDDAGWPYYYYDHLQKKKFLNPEYGGDGKKEGNGAKYLQPLIGFPGHWAPNDLHFYRGNQFPERYKNGAFIAFHGSTIRAPYPQEGYFIGFVPFKNGAPTGEWEVFADGFAGVDTIINTSDAMYRPMGIAMGPDGSLYISESEKGKIWRIMYKGDGKNFKLAQLTKMVQRKLRTNIKTPDEVADNLHKEMTSPAAQVYLTYCMGCHQQNGNGDGNRFPPLAKSSWVNGDKEKLIGVILNGLEGSVEVDGKMYNNSMPSHAFLKDEDVSQVLTFIRQNFGNNSDEVSVEEVKAARKKLTK
jgi:glucose/arabinose dehydrogenase